MKRFATIVFLCFCAVGLNLVPSTMAQTLSGEARSHWNKALIYIENAKAEDEWQMAVNELEQVISLAPDFTEAYLKLGDSYSQLSSSEVVEKAKYYWREYEKRTPSAATEIQDKIDSLEAHYEISVLRNREAIIESLVGRWRRNKDDNRDFGTVTGDIEIFRERGKLILRYVGQTYSKDDRSGGYMRYKEIIFDGNDLIIEWEDIHTSWDKEYINGERKYSKHMRMYKFYIDQPPIDGVIGGTFEEYGCYDVYLYKVN